MKPLLFDYAINRTGDATPIFHYDKELNLNVVNTDNGAVPFIDIDSNDIEMQTKTKIDRERDDDGMSLLELTTKTEVRREKDDDYSALLELTTKTLTQRERDDEDSAYN